MPTARIEATAYVKDIRQNEPSELWSEFGSATGMSRADFHRYFSGCVRGCAIVLDGVGAVVPALDLSTMKSEVAGFHPPQFFKRLGEQELKVLLQPREPRPRRNPLIAIV